MSNIPDKHKGKLQEDAKQFCELSKKPDIVISHKDYSLAGLMAYHEGAEKGYSLSLQTIQAKDEEIKRLREALQLIVDTKGRQNPDITAYKALKQ